MTKNAKIAAALVGGYVLGRTKKAKMAIGLGMFLAGKKLDLDPRRIGTLIAESPALAGLNAQVRKELVETTKAAATEALTKRATGLADSLADSISQRTKALDGPQDDEAEDEEGDEEEKPAKQQRSSASGGTRRKTAAARKSTGAAKSAASRSGGAAKKRASSATRKSGGNGNG
ncbi:hypothetical protein E5082_22585 [Streptomyces griseoluteus]|uniref:DNA primase n=1 Tax=Streptomyces griseoluteus TaxID=29306 RepID=A0A4Z1DCB6_STRGP|nr:hypothetical protein [Streptomyces griseoluteus]TGN80189.1 hypothetical protein E5082_22585 [Streptomyces griseoluteus]GHE95159.1 hypothetical protein GCM10017776_09340 [Streptomyces griseoluteus]